MRLDARNGDKGWSIWDCRRACAIKGCVWVDDSLSEYGVYAQPYKMVGGRLFINEFRADRIAIISESRLILIDPVSEEERDLIEVAISRPMPLAA
jgi:hypothetical protein